MKENLILYSGQLLGEDEYLLKVVDENETGCDPNDEDYEQPGGYLTKLNKDGSIPKSFLEWPSPHWLKDNFVPITVHTEEFRSGWKVTDIRYGKSQNWAMLIHPLGFTVEIYADCFFELVPKITISHGELIGEFKWSYGKLTMKK